jgi:hypothetical protein
VSFTITVVNGKGTGPGSVGVTTVFDSAPAILALTASPGQVPTRGEQ